VLIRPVSEAAGSASCTSLLGIRSLPWRAIAPGPKPMTSPGNQLIDLEQPIVWGLLDGLPRGTVLDAACGTGRHAEHLAGCPCRPRKWPAVAPCAAGRTCAYVALASGIEL